MHKMSAVHSIGSLFIAITVTFGATVPTHHALAGSVTLTPSADTTLMENYPTNNLGGARYFNSGSIQNGSLPPPYQYPRNRGLLKFDIAGQVPAGAKVTSVSLVVEVTLIAADNPGSSSQYDMHRVLRPWGEGDKFNFGSPSQDPQGLGAPATTNEATWFHRLAFTTNTWAAPGGAAGIDYATNLRAFKYLYGPTFSPYYFDSSPAIVADIQFWLDQPENNFGWILIAHPETAAWTARRFGSRESSLSPRLVIDFVLPPTITATNPPVLNHQSGLFVQVVTLSNNGDAPLDAVRVFITDLPPGVIVFNATGQTNGVPYVLYNQPLQPGESADLTLEYYVPDRVTVPNPTFIAEATAAEPPPSPGGTPQDIDRPARMLADGTFLIDFSTLDRKSYFIQYGAQVDGPWKAALPSLTGTGSHMQWIDNGPPKTESPPQAQTN